MVLALISRQIPAGWSVHLTGYCAALCLGDGAAVRGLLGHTRGGTPDHDAVQARRHGRLNPAILTWALLTRPLARGKRAGELGLGGSPGGGGDRLAHSGPRRVYETLGGVGRARRARLRVRSSPLVHGACGMGPAVACPACSSTWRRSKTSSVVFPSVFAAPRMIPVAPQRTSPSHASRHGR